MRSQLKLQRRRCSCGFEGVARRECQICSLCTSPRSLAPFGVTYSPNAGPGQGSTRRGKASYLPKIDSENHTGMLSAAMLKVGCRVILISYTFSSGCLSKHLPQTHRLSTIQKQWLKSLSSLGRRLIWCVLTIFYTYVGLLVSPACPEPVVHAVSRSRPAIQLASAVKYAFKLCVL